MPEAEHHTDRNQETILIITHITETIEIIKDIAIRIIIITIEAEAIIETIITEVELTVTTETIIITNTTIADQAQDTQTAVTQDSIHRTTEIMIIIITITIIDKDIIVKIQTKMIDTDNDRIVTIDIIPIIIIGMTEETQRKENKMIDIIQKIEEQTGNKYNNNNKNRINNIETERQNDDPPGIDNYEYTFESSNEDQGILDKFYNANEDTCNPLINTLESKPTWILPMYQ